MAGRAVDLGGPSAYQEGSKFEIKHRSRCLQKSKLVDWGAKHVDLGVGGRPSLGASPDGRRFFNRFLTWVARVISLGTSILVLELILLLVRLRGVTIHTSRRARQRCFGLSALISGPQV